MNLVVITPTYNEKENISTLIERVKTVFDENKLSGGMIIVEDNSPDGTAQIVEDLISKINSETFHLDIIKRSEKLGLGTAYIAGFKKALQTNTDYIMEMDADFSHDPKYIPDFVNALKDYDVVIGSRYVKGGGVVNWPFLRKMISKSGSLYSKLVLWWNIHDATAGFIAYRRKVLETLDLDKIRSNGYSFQVEMKYRAYQAGFKLKEIPIVFVDRINGVSKMSGKIVREAMKKVISLRFNK